MSYRRPHEEAWHAGSTINVSGSGVLFRGQEPLPPHVRVELRLALDAPAPGGGPQRLSCTGEIHRTRLLDEGTCAGVMAVHVDDYRFETAQ